MRRNDAGKLTAASRRAIRSAFAEVERQHRRSRANTELAKVSRDHMTRMERVSLREFAISVQDLTDSPVLGDLAADAASAARTKRIRNTTLKRQGKLATDLRRKMASTARDDALRMLDSGASLADVRARLVQVGQETTRRADNIGRNESETMNAQLSRAYQRAAGVDAYLWRGQLDADERPEHVEREGQRYTWDSPPFDGHPGEPVNCRCVAEPILPDALLEVADD